MAHPQIIFGMASFGFPNSAWQDVGAVSALLQTLRDLGITRLDTAARYPPNNPGQSETLLGEAKELAGGNAFLIDTKISTGVRNDGSGDLAKQAIEASVATSLERLQRPEGVSGLRSVTTPLSLGCK